MGIMQKAYETYDYMIHVSKEHAEPMAPVSHCIFNAKFEIELDDQGNFLRAVEIPKAEARTIIPVTEESAGRTSKAQAHPLCDQLAYLSTMHEDKQALYLQQLQNWAESEYTHPKLHAVLKYVKAGTVLKDLADWNLIQLEDMGCSAKDEKSLIRWRIHGCGDITACWEDEELQQLYQRYYSSISRDTTKDCCMITGEEVRVSRNYPQGIVAKSYGAKLISANDSTGFTYRGRFTDSSQAVSVGYEAAQKAHNALQWVVNNWGTTQGNRTFVCWNPKGKKLGPVGEASFTSDDETIKEASEYKEKLDKTFKGFCNELPNYEDVVIAVFDAATTGRLSLTYYNELKASDFHDRVKYWYGRCYWENGKFGLQAPTLWTIISSAYGVERNGKLEVDDKQIGEQMQRVFKCIVDRGSIPWDLVKRLVQRASTPLAYERNNREKILFTACALLRAKLNESKEEWDVDFDREKHKSDRSYQFGRLLALFEYIEKSTFDMESDKGRETNAIRMQTVFCEKPLHYAGVLRERVQPYMRKMEKTYPIKAAILERTINEIMENISESDSKMWNRPLGDTYIMGYYLQRKELYKKKKTEEEE